MRAFGFTLLAVGGAIVAALLSYASMVWFIPSNDCQTNTAASWGIFALVIGVGLTLGMAAVCVADADESGRRGPAAGLSTALIIGALLPIWPIVSIATAMATGDADSPRPIAEGFQLLLLGLAPTLPAIALLISALVEPRRGRVPLWLFGVSKAAVAALGVGALIAVVGVASASCR